MSKYLYISEKPSVAREFAKALKLNGSNKDGYIETDDAIVTWCVGHLVTMSYPEAYDPALKRWTFQTLPFIPEEFKYEVIPGVSKQFDIVKSLLTRKDVSRIYVCTDSGREGEYIYRLVDQMAGVGPDKEKYRVWIDSQTEEEILRGIKEAKPLSEYDNLGDAAYLRAMEDYLMGINFSRVITLKYGNNLMKYLNREKYMAISVGRVMTCVLGMVVRREREIRAFVKTPFYRVVGNFDLAGKMVEGEWKAVAGSKFFESPALYKENGFKEKEIALGLIDMLSQKQPLTAIVDKVEKKKELKNAPLLFNLAELQNECSKLFKISPDETLKIVQELYEKKLVTYPRTDARVLSTAVAKEIHKNIGGLKGYPVARELAGEVLASGSYKNIAKTRYVNDKQITDHYAIIPTGQGLSALNSVSMTASRVYEVIVRRFLSVFYPPAEYQKIGLTFLRENERFFANFKVLVNQGYLKVTTNSFSKRAKAKQDEDSDQGGSSDNANTLDEALLATLHALKKGTTVNIKDFAVKEGETSPPKRYNSGSLILAMENAGQLIEDEELRAQMKGSGIGTSATRAEILNKLIKIEYLSLNKKTQIVTPHLIGELVFDIVSASIKSLLNPELTASWEKGLTYVAEGTITKEEYMQKLESFIERMTDKVKTTNYQNQLYRYFDEAASNYKVKKSK
ncbi:MAG: DNA topoisomerase [bacterium]|nr:DNA topoisomerase [bacterium]